MIISRTPFRISFIGGGTDIKDFYKMEWGAVVSATINKYMYITVNKRFDKTIRISYSQTEIVEDVEEIKHPIVREALKLTGIREGIEITSIADIPARTGLGSSSSFTVGLLNALFIYKGKYLPPHRLAELACEIEIEKLKEPIGKQDQYIAAFGGLKYIQFNPDESVTVELLPITPEKIRKLFKSIILFYTGITRSASSILKQYKTPSEIRIKKLKEMKELVVQLKEIILTKPSIKKIGEILHKGWEIKKTLASGITNPLIDEAYRIARENGALGGKILGAGGGGFLMLLAEPKYHKQIIQKLKELKLREVKVDFEPEGSRIIFYGG